MGAAAVQHHHHRHDNNKNIINNSNNTRPGTGREGRNILHTTQFYSLWYPHDSASHVSDNSKRKYARHKSGADLCICLKDEIVRYTRMGFPILLPSVLLLCHILQISFVFFFIFRKAKKRNNLSTNSILRWCLTETGNPILEIRRRSFPLPVQIYFYIESGPGVRPFETVSHGWVSSLAPCYCNHLRLYDTPELTKSRSGEQGDPVFE